MTTATLALVLAAAFPPASGRLPRSPSSASRRTRPPSRSASTTGAPPRLGAGEREARRPPGGIPVLVASTPEGVPRGRGRPVGLGRVASPDPFVTYCGKPLASRTRYHWVRVWLEGGRDERVARAYLVRDRVPDRRRVAGPLDRGPRAGAGRVGGGRRTRRRHDPGRRRALPAGRVDHSFASRRYEKTRRVPRGCARAMLRRSFASRSRARARVYSSGPRLPGPGRERRPRVRRRPRSRLHRLQPHGPLHDHDVTGLLRFGENVVAAELGSGHYDDATKTGTGAGRTPSGAGSAAAPRAARRVRGRLRAGRRVRRHLEGQRRRPHALRQLLPRETYDAGARSPAGTGPASTTPRGQPPGSWRAPAGTPRAQAHEPIRVVGTRRRARVASPRRACSCTTSARTDRLGRDPDPGARRDAVEVFYSEKIDDRGRARRSATTSCSAKLQTDYYVARARARSAGRLGSATRASSTCS